MFHSESSHAQEMPLDHEVLLNHVRIRLPQNTTPMHHSYLEAIQVGLSFVYYQSFARKFPGPVDLYPVVRHMRSHLDVGFAIVRHPGVRFA